jgi:hypothetical protein
MLKLSATIDALARWFRDVNYSAENEAAAMRYARQRHAMLFGAGQELPSIQKVRSDEAVTLTVGSTLYDGYRFKTRVIDETGEDVPFFALGHTEEQAKARAAQLVSALDGARRL